MTYTSASVRAAYQLPSRTIKQDLEASGVIYGVDGTDRDELVGMWLATFGDHLPMVEPTCSHLEYGCAGSCRAELACND